MGAGNGAAMVAGRQLGAPVMANLDLFSSLFKRKTAAPATEPVLTGGLFD